MSDTDIFDDHDKMVDAMCVILKGLGEKSDNLQRSKKIISGYRNLLRGYCCDPTSEIRYVESQVSDGQVLIFHKIPFISFCEHHFMPFDGYVSVSYVPNGKLVGVANIIKFVGLASAKLQIQEKMTSYICEALDGVLTPFGVSVLIKATHKCVVCYDRLEYKTEFMTSHSTGCFVTDPLKLQEFISRTPFQN